MKRLALSVVVSAAFMAASFACSSPDVATTPGGAAPGAEGEKDAGFQRDGTVYDSAPTPDSGLGLLRFMPGELFTGYDGTNTFVAPIAVYDGADDLEVTASDGSTVDVKAVKLKSPVLPDGTVDNGAYYFITAKKSGTVTITAKSKGRTAEATVEVVDYAASRFGVGENRYTNGANGDPPCTQCHVDGTAIDHSPATMASVPDNQLVSTITTGIKPGGTPISGVTGGHRWQTTQNERDGLVTYLRGLTPRGFQ